MKRLFETKIYQEDGLYGVWLCVHGRWELIKLDDNFVCYSKTRGPAFSKAVGNELWVLLLEKAWAKVYKTFENIVSGSSVDALNSLTGAPGKMTDFKPDEGRKAFQFILDNERKKFMMTCSSKSEDGVEQEDIKSGIVSKHCYAILDCKKTSRGDELIKIRNPWGSNEWKGDWSDKSSKWTPDLK